MLLVRFSDRYSLNENATQQKVLHHVQCQSVFTLQKVGAADGKFEMNMGSAPFIPHDSSPGPWHQIVVTVSPERIEVQWGLVGEELRMVGDFSATSVADGPLLLEPLRQVLRERQLETPGFNLRGGIGLFARSSIVAFRNASLEPLTD
jgi:hypothetical protein